MIPYRTWVPGALLLVFALWVPVPAAARPGPLLLWEVGRCTAGPSFVFAILHSEDPRVTEQVSAVLPALRRSGRLAMEVVPNQASLTLLQAASYFTDGRSLDSILGARLFSATQRRMSRYGVTPDLLARMQPWAVVATLSLPRPSTGVFQEMLLYWRAAEAGVPTVALEQVPEEIALFAGLPRALQTRLVRATVEHYGAGLRALDTLRGAYLAGDLPALDRLQADYPTFREDPEAAAAFREILEHNNRRLVRRLLKRFHQGPLFAAITALNLPGPNGVLQGLEAGGCSLTRVPLGGAATQVRSVRPLADTSGFGK
ncbi:MAG: hypothetical protein B7Z66_03675 [Chromatiales bacterium 21-64-14]|nr:MAG: hypothetical protein B7Z66_03675 [Chromatiales bacterium 21-64-14]HQU14822.1 TraB/GumN family protein [Gammaproteobacteria bacterium]